LATAGGKGANLARLARAGIAVPPGFLLTTDAYRAFVDANSLQPAIADALAALIEQPDPAALDAASARILAAFTAAALPDAIAEELLAARHALEAPSVAVRSSATAEDLPDLSFAGQQETTLNVVGDEQLLQAVISCFASLWTARAIGYRMRNQIANDEVALAVVVQAMVQSEASGVLFTANPLTGHRGETVIDAIRGLGEALVSGQVEPDHYVVESASGEIRSRTQGAKAVVIRSSEGGGVERVEDAAGAAAWALDDETVRELVRLGRAVAVEYGEPQDIEWALAGGEVSLLQARPITSLFPLPTTLPPATPGEAPALLFSLSAVQGLQDPMTPMGQEALKTLAAGFASAYGYDFQPGEVPALHFAAGRPWIRFDPLLRNKATHGLWKRVFPLIEAGSRDEFVALINDPRTLPSRALPTAETRARLLPLVRVAAAGAVRSMANPEQQRQAALETIERLLAEAERYTAQAQTLTDRVRAARMVLHNVVPLLFTLVPVLGPGLAGLYRFMAMAEGAGIPRSRTLELLRGLPHNVTTEMDLALWEVARTVKQDADARAAMAETTAAALAADWKSGALPPSAQAAIDGFMARYGMRGVAEFDMGRPRWRDDATQVMQMVQNYLQIENPDQAPDVVFRRGAQAAEAAIGEMVAEIEEKRGPAQARVAAFLAQRARALAGLRETPKFTVMRLMGIARKSLFRSFEELAAQGLLETAQDGVFLTFPELEALDAGYAIDWKALVAERKANHAREVRRKQVPRLLVGDGRAFHGSGENGDAVALSADGRTLHGTPVSPGSAEGPVHVVFEPHGTHLEPGEILVCPGTDPAWTPLFLSAGGLVMEVGGLMTHGSVVAREYGIPAVVGVPQATSSLRTGMRIRIDGSSGLIQMLDGEPQAE
jgi:pyruvate,water dikinase